MLNHPNAVSVFDIGETGQVTYIAMELVEGSTLRAHMSNLTLSATIKISWIHAIASVLAAAHAAGLIHRDIKPENIMIRRDGVVKVLDFGAVKRMKGPSAPTVDRTHDLTAEGLVVGTPAYMAPEAFERVVGPGTDQFAWGVVAYELLTSRHPFQRPPGVGHYEWVREHAPTPLHRVARDVSRPVGDVVMRAIAKRPKDRFPSMADLVRELEGCSDVLSESTIETPALPPEPTSTRVDDGPTQVDQRRRR
jgi:serine/threonine-protein kinase